MLYRPLGRTGEMVSILGFGAMRLPVIDHQHEQIDVPLATEMLEYAISQGVNYVDTARMYHGANAVAPGNSEPFIGQALDGGLRDKVLLATKLPSWAANTREDMDRTLAHQLRALRTDHIDCYLLHGIGAETWAKFRDLGALDFLEAAKADGRIRFAGFSFHGDGSAFAPIVDAYDWDFCQIQYNYMDIEQQAGMAGLRYAAERGLGVIVMEPIRGGRLAGRVPVEAQAIWDKAPTKRTPVEWALRFVWDDKDVSMLLSGMGSMEQVRENIRLADEGHAGALGRVELDLYDQVRRIYRDRTLVDCTGCRYCMPCPAGIDIPTIFSLMNDGRLYGDEAQEKFVYGLNIELGATVKASECTECGQCEAECPQLIEVPKRLADAVAMFED
jgi:predicted aldo/keto reductase-like oxidoreductase